MLSLSAAAEFDHAGRDRLETLAADIVGCDRCPRLRRHCEKIAKLRRRAYRDEMYWGKPVPGFGNPRAALLIVGLAPGVHGANRTGRMFTGDGSGEFLFAALHRAGFCNQPVSRTAHDGLRLSGAYVTAVARCAPPDNRLRPNEIANCRRFLTREIGLLRKVRAVLVLGRVALDGYRSAMVERGHDLKPKKILFRHGASYDCGPPLPRLYVAYHPSRQNTQTGRLTPSMYDRIFLDIRRQLASPARNGSS